MKILWRWKICIVVKNLMQAFQAFQFLQATPAEQQAVALTALFRMAGPQYLNINADQVEVILSAFNNPQILDANGIPNEDLLDDIFQQFNAAATPVAPLRIVCKHCEKMNKVVLNG